MSVFHRLVMMFALAVLVEAAAAFALPTAAQMLAPFIDSQTILVVELNLDKIDIDAANDWRVQTFKKLNFEPGDDFVMSVDGAMTVLKQGLQEARKAGIGRLYYILSLSDFPSGEGFIGTCVVPVERGADVEAVKKWLTSSHRLQASSIGDVVVATAPKKPAPLQAPQPQTHGASKELAEILERDREADARVAILLSDDLRRVLDEMLPQVPPEGGGKMSALTKGARWGAIDINFPPGGSIDLMIQAKDAASAKEIAQELAAAEAAVARRVEISLPAAAIKGDQVLVSLSETDMARPLPQLVQVLRQAREDAMRAQSTSNVRQILLACLMYAQAHDGAFPPEKDWQNSIKQYLPPQVFQNPLRPQQEPGYVYIHPAAGAKAPRTSVVIHEAYEKWPGRVVVGYGDGSFQVVADEKELNKQLEATRRVNQQATP